MTKFFVTILAMAKPLFLKGKEKEERLFSEVLSCSSLCPPFFALISRNKYFKIKGELSLIPYQVSKAGIWTFTASDSQAKMIQNAYLKI